MRLYVPRETIERVVAVEILLLGELLEVTYAAEPPFPHFDVEDDEADQKDGTEKWAAVGDKEDRVEGSM